MEFRAPPEWAAMPGDDTPPADRDPAWWSRCAFVDVDMATTEASLVSALLRRGLPHARLVKLERVQNRMLRMRYDQARHLVNLRAGEVNEQWLFHGTYTSTPADLCEDPEGLDPRRSSGGFYGCGTYLAESAAYGAGGRYAHRVAGHDGARMQLLIVRAAAGAVQDFGGRVDAETKAMKMPGCRDDGRRYDSVRAGPHRPALAGPGDGGDGDDASIIWVLYKARAAALSSPLARLLLIARWFRGAARRRSRCTRRLS